MPIVCEGRYRCGILDYGPIGDLLQPEARITGFLTYDGAWWLGAGISRRRS